jgi:hypothetical protein
MSAKEEAADQIMAQVMARVDGLAELAKLAVIEADGGKAMALNLMAECIEEGLPTKTEIARLLSVVLIDRAIKELTNE